MSKTDEWPRRFRVLATSILAHAELARRGEETNESLAHHLDEIVRRAEEIYEGSEAVSPGAPSSDPEADEIVDVYALLDDAVRAARRLAGEPGVDVKVRLEPGLPALRSDGERLRSLLVSLLVRTLRSAGWTEVRIDGSLAPLPGCRTARPMVRLSVADGAASRPAPEEEAPPEDLSVLVSGSLAEVLGVAVRAEPCDVSGRRYEVLIPIA